MGQTVNILNHKKILLRNEKTIKRNDKTKNLGKQNVH